MLRVPSSTGVVEVAVVALLPDLDGLALAALAADTDAFGVVTAVPERRRAARADPLAAAFVPALLLLEPLGEPLHQLVPAQCLDLRAFFLREMSLGQQLQPVFGQRFLQRLECLLDALEVLRERAVEPVEMFFVLDQRGAGQEIEIVHAETRDVLRALRAASGTP